MSKKYATLKWERKRKAANCWRCAIFTRALPSYCFDLKFQSRRGK
jgi:hypothetical protein